MDIERLHKQLEFVMEMDKLKYIMRQSYVADGSRHEGDAEHSWHLALMAMLLSEYSNEEIDVLHVIKMVLIHDAVEIDAGDTYAYDETGNATKRQREEQAADRIFNILSADQAKELRDIWEEFEANETAEARFANALDRIQPILLNDATGGRAWREHNVAASQVIRRNSGSHLGSETLWKHAESLIEKNKKGGNLLNEEYETILERYALALERIKTFLSGDTVIPEPYLDYFQKTAVFLQSMDVLKKHVDSKDLKHASLEDMKEYNKGLYSDILPEAYEVSYANPAFAVKQLGADYGQLLCFLYTELRGMIIYAVEKRFFEMTIHIELFNEVLCLFESGEVSAKELRNILYYFVSDYASYTLDYRTKELLDPNLDFATRIIMDSDLNDLRYLFSYGEYITENEIRLADFLNRMSSEEIEKMAYTYTHGYEEGFRIAGIDLSKKKTVNIRYSIGQERLVKAAILQFEKIGLRPVIYRAPIARVNRKLTMKPGYSATSPNKQYEYDHRMDDALFFDKAFAERKLLVLRNAYESRKELAKEYAGPAVIEVFGEIPFEPVNKKENLKLSEKQQELSVFTASESAKLVNEYIPQSDYSFTIIAYPLPEIGDNFEEIFKKIVEVNTLDNEAYKQVQQTIIDELDKAVSVRVVGKGENRTDITVRMHDLHNPEKETNFENCTADVNIPVGEVFTSPKLTGTNGILNVSEVYLNDLKFKNIMLTFEDGKITDYTCDNFASDMENKAYIKENVLFNRETLPIGEFAIGTNTTAYVTANQYDIVYKLPILIVEKMGPHFAVGDTCYSRSEEIQLYNPDGKEIVAKENECSLLRFTDEDKAYFNCHTDITIPYDEIAGIYSVHADGTKVAIIEDGRFVLKGCEMLNKPFSE